jgi:hypothetical protein
MVRVALSGSDEFDLLLFRRSLHHIALNHVAAINGAQLTLNAVYDSARRYIRAPQRGEAWPFAERDTPGASVPRSVSVRLLGPRPHYSVVQVFHYEFLVDLHARPEFAAFAEHHGFSTVGPEVTTLPPVSITYIESGEAAAP